MILCLKFRLTNENHRLPLNGLQHNLKETDVLYIIGVPSFIKVQSFMKIQSFIEVQSLLGTTPEPNKIDYLFIKGLTQKITWFIHSVTGAD